MANSNVTTLESNFKWGDNPAIYFNFTYQKMRSGTTQEYIIGVECKPLTGASYFGYPIYVEIIVDRGDRIYKTLKNASPSQWSSALSCTTSIISVENKTSGTTPIVIRIYSGEGSTRSVTYNGSLLIDPAPSDIAATDANIESTSVITFTRYNTSYTHTLSYRPEGYEGFTGNEEYTNIFEKQDISIYGWTVPKSLYQYIPNEKRVRVRLKCDTYKGNTLVGTDGCIMYATTNTSTHAPGVSINAEDVNANTIALTGDNKKIIKFHSDVKVTAVASSEYEAKISNLTLKCGTKKHSTDNANGKGALSSSYQFEDVQSASVSATATDTRGYSKTVNAEGLTLIEYVKLTAKTTVARTSPTGDEVTFTTKGNFYPGSFGAERNHLRTQIAYKLQGTENFSSYTTMDVTAKDGTYTATVTLTGFDYTKNYDIRIRVQDRIYKEGGPLADAVYNNFVLQKGVPVYDWGENDFRFNVPVKLPANQYQKNNVHGIDANNSDIVNLNGMYFKDVTDTEDEGIKFYRDGTNWDRLYARDGSVYIQPNCPTNTNSYLLYSSENKPYYEAGDTDTITNVFAGAVTGERKTFYVNIPLVKPIAADTVSISGGIIGRGISGYVLDSYNNPVELSGGTGYTVKVNKTNSGIRVVITYNTEQTAGLTNNTTISWYGTLTLTFE